MSKVLLFLLHPRSPMAALFSLVSFAASAAELVAGDISTQLTGVPLPVLLAAAAGAFFSRAYGPEMNLGRALAVVAGWTAAGCAGAPILQAVAIVAVKRYLEVDLNVPGGFLAFAALVIASVAWWGPKAWPFIKGWLPFKAPTSTKDGGGG